MSEMGCRELKSWCCSAAHSLKVLRENSIPGFFSSCQMLTAFLGLWFLPLGSKLLATTSVVLVLERISSPFENPMITLVSLHQVRIISPHARSQKQQLNSMFKSNSPLPCKNIFPGCRDFEEGFLGKIFPHCNNPSSRQSHQVGTLQSDLNKLSCDSQSCCLVGGHFIT